LRADEEAAYPDLCLPIGRQDYLRDAKADIDRRSSASRRRIRDINFECWRAGSGVTRKNARRWRPLSIDRALKWLQWTFGFARIRLKEVSAEQCDCDKIKKHIREASK
jgi:hypothetical protein